MRETPTTAARRLAVLACFVLLLPALALAQGDPPKPTPAPPAAGGAAVLVGDGSDIEPQAAQPFAGGQTATFERSVAVARGDVREATCVSVKLRPRPEELDATLSGTITPKWQTSRCAEGEILTCGPKDRNDCGKYTVAIGSQVATPPQTYRFDLVGRCATCVPIQEKVGVVRLAIVKPRIDLTVAPGTPGSAIVPAGTSATFTIAVQRTFYLGQIDITTQVQNDPQSTITVATVPPTILPSTKADERHLVLVIATTRAPGPGGGGTPPGLHPIVAGARLPVLADIFPATANLTVTSTPASEALSIFIEPESQEARRSTCPTYRLTIGHDNFPVGFQGSALLSLLPSGTPFPSGMSFRFDPPAVAITGDTGSVTARLLIEVPPEAPPVTPLAIYDFTVEAKAMVNGRTVSHRDGASVTTLQAPPLITLTSTNGDESPPIPRGGSFTFNLTLDRRVSQCAAGRVGFAGDVVLATPNPPIGVTGFFMQQPGDKDQARFTVIVGPDAVGRAEFIIESSTKDYQVGPRTVAVVVQPPPLPPTSNLTAAPMSLAFSGTAGGPSPMPRSLAIGSTAGALDWSASDNAPWLTVSPASGITGSVTTVSVNTAGLAAGSYSAAITVTAPGASPVTVPVSLTVTTVGGGTPVVNGFTPVSGGPGTSVEVIGGNFTGVTQVLFNNAPAAFQPNSAGRLFATVPNGATTGPIRVTNASGTGASFTPFTVTAGAAPSVSGFSPASGAPGDRITIQGANFKDPSQVFFNDTLSPFVLFAGPSFLSADVPSGAASGPIRVTTSAGSGTSAQSFVVTGSPPPPPPPPPPSGSLTVSPASLSFTAPQGGPAPPVQALSIGSTGAALSWIASDNAAFVNLAPASGITPGATNVSINVGGLAAGSYGAAITVTAPGAPAVTVPVSLIVTAVGAGTPVVNGFNPVSGGPGTSVEVIGANFTGVTQVLFNTAPATFQPNTAGRLFATVPAGATTGPIRVTNGSGTGASFTPFTVTAGAAPSISGFSPSSGRPGDRITIQGANFKDPSQVFFNDTLSPFVLFAGPSFLSAEVPQGATSGPIRVTTSSGSAISAQSFVVTASQ